MSKWYDLEKLNSFKKGYYSQDQDDKVLEYIFENIGTTSKYCVEIGVGKWNKSPNTKYFREKGWDGCGIELRAKYNSEEIRKKYSIHTSAVTDKNINDLFEKYKIPKDLDLISLDIDGQDYYVWKALKWKPRVMIVEFNEGLGPDINVVMRWEKRHWKHRDSTYYYGASIQAFKNLGKEKGYTLLSKVGRNLIFILDGILPEKIDRDVNIIHPVAMPESYKKPDPKKRKWVQLDD